MEQVAFTMDIYFLVRWQQNGYIIPSQMTIYNETSCFKSNVSTKHHAY